MRSRTPSGRVLPDGIAEPAARSTADTRLRPDRHASAARVGRRRRSAPRSRPAHRDVYFPNGGVFSITNRMRDGELVEVATVGREGMLGIGVFLGDRSATGRTFLQVADGPVASLAVARFVEETANGGMFREVIGRTRRRAAADDAVHGLQCPARRDATLLPLAAADARPRRHGRLRAEAGVPGVMLGVRRATVTVVLGALQEAGLISSRRPHAC